MGLVRWGWCGAGVGLWWGCGGARVKVVRRGLAWLGQRWIGAWGGGGAEARLQGSVGDPLAGIGEVEAQDLPCRAHQRVHGGARHRSDALARVVVLDVGPDELGQVGRQPVQRRRRGPVAAQSAERQVDELRRLGRCSGRGRAHRALASPIRTSFSEGFADSASDGGFAVSFLCAKYSSRSSGFSSIRVGLRLSIRSE